VSWNALGQTNDVVQVLRNGTVIYTTTPGQKTYLDPFSVAGPGLKSYQLKGVSSGGGITMSNVVNVNPWCLQSFNVAVTTGCDEWCYRYTWNVQGLVSGRVTIYQKKGGGGFVQRTDPDVPLSPQSYNDRIFDQDTCIPSQHYIVVNVGGQQVTSAIVGLGPTFCTPTPVIT
jgi:hypothetical protein